MAGAADFIDPNTLAIGKSYTLSKRTPLMPHYRGTNAASAQYLESGSKIQINSDKKVRNVIWYHVGSENKQGWVNSIALFGQKLKNN